MTQLLENTASRPVLIPTLCGGAARVEPCPEMQQSAPQRRREKRERGIARLKGEAAATNATADSARGEALRVSTVGCQLLTNAARRGGESCSRSGAEQGKIARFPFLAVKEPSA
jgi:hypothetical protein